MTKKDYELIAQVFNAEVRLCKALDFDDTDALFRLRVRLAVKLKAENPKFDPHKFSIACGI